MSRARPFQWIAFVAGVACVASCGGAPAPPHDGSPSGEAATPGDDAALEADTVPSDPAPPSTSCEQRAVDLTEVCPDPATCAVRRAVDLDCNGHLVGKVDLAVAPMGTAFVALTLDVADVAALFEVDAPGHLEVDGVGDVRPIVHAGAGGARVLMAGGSGSPSWVARPGNGAWTVEPLPGAGTVYDFLLADDGAMTLLEGRAGDGGAPRLSLTDLASGAGTLVAEGGPTEYAKVARARDGSAVVVYTQPGPSGLVVHRWQLGVGTELGTLPRDHLGPPSPALKLATALVDDSITAVFSADGGLFRLPAVPLLPTPAWKGPECIGFMTVDAPDICPDDGPSVALGEQVIDHALAGTWLAAMTGSVEARCAWSRGGCIETAPCDCDEREADDVLAPRLRVRSLDASAREASIGLSRGGMTASVAAATDAAGLVYVAAHDTAARVRLFVVDPTRL
jgi:hypothetical protein